MSIFINRIIMFNYAMRPHQITGCSSSPIDNEHTHVLLFYVFLQLIVFLSKKNYVNMTKMPLFKAGPCLGNHSILLIVLMRDFGDDELSK